MSILYFANKAVEPVLLLCLYYKSIIGKSFYYVPALFLWIFKWQTKAYHDFVNFKTDRLNFSIPKVCSYGVRVP